MDADAAVRAQDIVHVDLADPLLRFFLKSSCAWCEVRIFIAENLIGNLAGQDDTDVCVFMDPFADQIHADRGAYCRDVPGTEGVDNGLQSCDDIVPRHDHFVVVAPDIIRHFTGVFQVDGIQIHSDGKSLKRLVQQLCSSPADQG